MSSRTAEERFALRVAGSRWTVDRARVCLHLRLVRHAFERLVALHGEIKLGNKVGDVRAVDYENGSPRSPMPSLEWRGVRGHLRRSEC